MPEHDIIIVCPLRVEARAVERALRRTGLTGIELRCCGIGALAVRRALATESSRPVLLVGLGGGLDPEMAIGNTYLAERVVDEGGRTWTPTPLSTNGAIGRCTIVGMDRIVEGPDDRRAVRAGTGAAVVDMEAHALGAWADEVALPWQVLRSVSDASGDTLPAEAIAWFTPQGGIRGGRIAFDLIRRPPCCDPSCTCDAPSLRRCEVWMPPSARPCSHSGRPCDDPRDRSGNSGIRTISPHCRGHL